MVLEMAISTVVEKFMLEQNFDVFRQVPLITRRIDLLCVSRESKDIVAIEVKVKNWKKAFQQAVIYRLCADEVYVALWHKYAHRANLDLFESCGIGLLKVNNSVEVTQPARKNGMVQPSLKEGVKVYVLNNGFG